MEPDNPLLDRFVLRLARKRRPRVCFIATASGDADLYYGKFYAAFAKLPATATHLSLFLPPPGSLRSFVAQQDVFYVGGGSTRNLLVLWKAWGLDVMLRSAWRRGAVLAGISAGAICWFDYGLTDSVATNELHPLRCLGFIGGSCSPHYDGEPERRPMFHRYVANGALPPGYAVDDGAALHFVGRKLAGVVSSRPLAKGYRVRRVEQRAIETALPTRFLGRR